MTMRDLLDRLRRLTWRDAIDGAAFAASVILVIYTMMTF